MVDEADLVGEAPEFNMEESAAEVRLDEVLDLHVRDIEPQAHGPKAERENYSGDVLAVVDCRVHRPEPPLEIKEFVLRKGQSVVVIGPNGSGKSTFLNAITALSGTREAGFDRDNGDGVLVVGHSSHAGREKVREARLNQEELLEVVGGLPAGQVLQMAAKKYKSEFPDSWGELEKLDPVAQAEAWEAAQQKATENEAARHRIDELSGKITELFGMSEFLDTKVNSLSGGEKTKLALFMMMLSEPDVLILDEPTNHLDLRSISELSELLKVYNQAGVSVVSVSHVRWFLEEAGRDGVYYVDLNGDGRTLSPAGHTYRGYEQNPNRPRSKTINGPINWGAEDYKYKYRKGEVLVAKAPEVTVADSPLKNIDVPEVVGGEMVILLGDNGAGKTRLLEEMMRRREDGRANVAYLPQFWPQEVAGGNLEDFFNWVKDSASPHSTGSVQNEEKFPRDAFVDRLKELKFGGISEHRGTFGWLDKNLSQFSGGEQRLMWFVAVSVLRDVDLLALDEPTNHMDAEMQKKVIGAVTSFPGAVVISTHDINLIEAVSDSAEAAGGNPRALKHIDLEKTDGRTLVSINDLQTPIEYARAIQAEAKEAARRFGRALKNI